MVELWKCEDSIKTDASDGEVYLSLLQSTGPRIDGRCGIIGDLSAHRPLDPGEADRHSISHRAVCRRDSTTGGRDSSGIARSDSSATLLRSIRLRPYRSLSLLHRCRRRPNSHRRGTARFPDRCSRHRVIAPVAHPSRRSTFLRLNRYPSAIASVPLTLRRSNRVRLR